MRIRKYIYNDSLEMYEQVEEYQRNHNATQLINHEVNKTKLINYISISRPTEAKKSSTLNQSIIHPNNN